MYVKSEDCIVFENSYSGMIAAKKVGIKVVEFKNNLKNQPQNNGNFTIDNFFHFDEIFALSP